MPDVPTKHPIKHVSFSAIKSFRACPAKWELEYLYRLSSSSPRLDLGTAVHRVKEELYKHDSDPHKDRIEQVSDAYFIASNIRQVAGLDHGRFPDGIEDLLTWVLLGYAEHYEEADSHLTVHHTEHQLMVPFLEDEGIFLKAIIDAIFYDHRTKEWWIRDFKSILTDPSGLEHQQHLRLDVQFPVYVYAARLAGFPVVGAEYDSIRAKPLKTRELAPEERFNRFRIRYTDRELAAIWAEAQATGRQMLRVQAGLDPIVSNPDKSCSYMCSFFGAHITARADGRSLVETAIQYDFKPRPTVPGGER